MNWLNKLEKKIGRFAIPNLIVWLIGANCIGFAVYQVNPELTGLLTLSPYHILQGQVWRLFTWIMMPTESNIIFLLIMALFYYQLGTTLERAWGIFRFNAYIISGMLFSVIGAFAYYGIMYLVGGGVSADMYYMGYNFSLRYIELSIFLAFALLFPEMQVMFYFVIPIKMKWMAYIYLAFAGYSLITTGWPGRVAIVMSLLNFLIFFLSTRDYRRISPKEIHRKQVYRAQTREPRMGNGITKHKCAVCGRTEVDDPTLEFRFCSKCEGNYEYCQDHLFTHTHIMRR